MDTTFKQRILGIIVLLALLGICLTLLLHNNKNPRQPKFSSQASTINLRPSLSTTTTTILSTKPTATTTITTPVNASSLSSLSQDQLSLNHNNNNSNANALLQTSQAPQVQTQPSQPLTPQPSTQASTSKIATFPNTTAIKREETLAPTTSSTPIVASTAPAPISTSMPTITISTTTPAQHHPAAKPVAFHANAINGIVVQVGSFIQEKNADILATKLRAQGFTATTQKIQTKQGEMTRVIVGGQALGHQAAEKLRVRLAKEMNLPGFITPAHEK